MDAFDVIKNSGCEILSRTYFIVLFSLLCADFGKTPSPTKFLTLSPTTEYPTVRRTGAPTKKPTLSFPIGIADSARIVGGEDVTDPNRYPWHAVKFSDGNLCGGTLIHEDIILSAAHCDPDSNYRQAFFLNSNIINAGFQVSPIDAVIHPNYVDEVVAGGALVFEFYDAMIYKLERSVTEISPAKLNRDLSSPSNGDVLISIGYGRTEVPDPAFSTILKQVALNFTDIDTCNALYSDVLQFSAIYPGGFPANSTVCAGTSPDKAPCFGDSGGPLIDSSDTLVGITAGGAVNADGVCSTGLKPAYYTDVAGIIGWIDSTICALSSNPPDSCVSVPTEVPSKQPSVSLSTVPTGVSSKQPSVSPSTSLVPTGVPSNQPSVSPSISLMPSGKPSYFRLPKPTKPSIAIANPSIIQSSIKPH